MLVLVAGSHTWAVPPTVASFSAGYFGWENQSTLPLFISTAWMALVGMCRRGPHEPSASVVARGLCVRPAAWIVRAARAVGASSGQKASWPARQESFAQ